MTEKQYSLEEIKKQVIKHMIEKEPLISDEEAFLRHLIRKWSN